MTKGPKQHSILKINDDGSIPGNTQQLNATIAVLEDEDEQFPLAKGKLHIPENQVEDCIQRYHDSPLKGHPGVTETLRTIRRSCHSKGMREHVMEYIKNCTACERNRHTTHKKYGELQFQPPPAQPWLEIKMDFITKLPLSTDLITEEDYDSILVIVDRLTKYSHLIPFRRDFDTKEMGQILLDKLIRYHGIPTIMTSDRDKLFTSAYWKTLLSSLGVKLKLSTAYHPQTDGQTERTNQTLERYLRHYSTFTQDNWVQLLPMAQLALNGRVSATT